MKWCECEIEVHDRETRTTKQQCEKQDLGISLHARTRKALLLESVPLVVHLL